MEEGGLFAINKNESPRGHSLRGLLICVDCRGNFHCRIAHGKSHQERVKKEARVTFITLTGGGIVL